MVERKYIKFTPKSHSDVVETHFFLTFHICIDKVTEDFCASFLQTNTEMKNHPFPPPSAGVRALCHAHNLLTKQEI